MPDPAQEKQFLDLVPKVAAALPDVFIRPGRDPARIDTVLERLQEVWTQNPHFRLGQLIVNVARTTQPCPEIFYLEDDALLRGLNKFGAREQSGES